MTEWFSTSSGAAYLDVSVATLKRWVYAGQIEFVQYGPGSPIRFTRAQLDAFIAANTVARSAGVAS